MDDEHQNPERGKRGRKASRGQAERDQRNPPELLAYSIDDVCERVPFKRSFAYEEIKAGRLIARKAGVYAAVTNCATEATGYSGRAGLKVYRIF